jgi:Flp pilus assembly pilin Flp
MTRHLSALGRTFARLGRDEHGGETLEYAMTLGFLAVMSYVLIQTVGVKFYNVWDRIDRALAMLG